VGSFFHDYRAGPVGFALRFFMRYLFFALGFLALLTAKIVDGQTPKPSGPADGFVHSELTLESQLISIAFSPDLSASDESHQALIAGTIGSRVEVGRLEGHRALRLGSIIPNLTEVQAEPSDQDAVTDNTIIRIEDQPIASSYQLWLVRSQHGWDLEAQAVDTDDVKTVPLTRREADAITPTFTASLHPTAAEAGRLVLDWEQHVWTADFRFDEIPSAPRRPLVSGRGEARSGDSDPDEITRSREVARRFTLRERNETALVLPDGSRISINTWKGVDIDDDDYEGLGTTPDGTVIPFVHAPPLRFKTDISLRFGQRQIPTGNVAPGFAGAYGIWLKRFGKQWLFVFNDEPDSWGTQHNVELDAAEVLVDYTRTDGAFRPLGATVVSTGVDQGRLVVHWGPHEWAAEFTIER